MQIHRLALLFAGPVLAIGIMGINASSARGATLAAGPTTASAQPTTAPTTAPVSLFRDPLDGAFDISGFLSTRTGFLPIAMPITEPAVGYGVGGGLVFFHTKPRVIQSDTGPRVIPPDATAVFGMATANGSLAGGAAHLHTWNDGRIRYLVAAGYGSLNLEWYGQSNAFAGRAFAYNLEAFFELQKFTFKLGESDFFIGPTQRVLATSSSFDGDPPDLPPPGPGLGILSDELQSTVSGLGLTFGYDTRDSLFSPTRGTKASLGYTQNAEAIGSDFNYGRLDAEICQYVPLGGHYTLGLRVQAAYLGDQAPFFDMASVQLRGIPAGRYVDNSGVTFEAELRWDVTTRWTLLGFAGVGWVAEEFSDLGDSGTEPAGGAGFRYLIARQYDLRIGCDIARGPEDWAFYVGVGTGWLRD